MNWDQVQGSWKQFKGQVKQKWGDLTDDEIDRVEGRQEELAGLIQKKYGKTSEEASAKSTIGPEPSDRLLTNEKARRLPGFLLRPSRLSLLDRRQHVAHVQGLDEPGTLRFDGDPIERVDRANAAAGRLACPVRRARLTPPGLRRGRRPLSCPFSSLRLLDPLAARVVVGAPVVSHLERRRPTRHCRPAGSAVGRAP